MSAVEEGGANRRIAPPVRLEVAASMPDEIVEMLRKKFCLSEEQVYHNSGPLAMVDFWGLLDFDRPDLKDEPFVPAIPPRLTGGEDILGALEEQDVLLYHPYDSFIPVIRMLEQAARDPDKERTRGVGQADGRSHIFREGAVLTELPGEVVALEKRISPIAAPPSMGSAMVKNNSICASSLQQCGQNGGKKASQQRREHAQRH